MHRTLVALAVLAVAGAAHADAALYAKRCASCHGKDGKPSPIGQKMGAKDLGGTKLSEAEIAAVISDGKGKMTPFKGKLSEAEIQSLAKFVKGGLK